MTTRSRKNRKSGIARAATIERRLRAELGARAEGKLVALHERTGEYVVADDLDHLVQAMIRGGLAASEQLHIFRVGERAAIELRRR
jgi:hypothetical protein